MNIIFDSDITAALSQTHTLLELDTIGCGDQQRVAYCVLNPSTLNTEDLFNLDRLVELHAALIARYKAKDFEFCINALSALQGQFGGQLDSFYEILANRIHTGNTNEIFD